MTIKSKEDIKVKKAQSQKEIEDALSVRYRVFVVEQKIDPILQHDPSDDICDHFLAYINNRPVGAGRIRYMDSKTAKIERMAVLPDLRGKNIGGKILNVMLDHIKEIGISEAILNSQYQAKGFYEKFGFEVEGGVFQEADIDHVKMRKRIGIA